ncbi:MAG: phosphate-selective porin OprO and OprP [Verrucomicrobiota bacterium]|jgi:phosphate-selective porin OprO/OprP
MLPITRPNDRRIAHRLAGCFLCFVILACHTAAAETKSDSERLEKLERAVELLQKRNTELEQEVKSLKHEKSAPPAPLSAEKRSRFVPDSKSAVVEKTETTEEKKPVYVLPGGSEFKLTLGGYLQANFEGGDVSAFEGRFGLTAVKDRFRLRRARITLSGDFAEQFDFTVQGDFEQSDGLSPTTRTGFSATDVFINWHGIPEANLKVGQWKAPFGLEQLTPDATIFTIERSLPTGALTPERQLGVMLWGKPLANAVPDQKDLVTYYAGIFNGNGRNFNVNDNNEFMYVGRLELLPFKGKWMGQDASLKIAGDYLFSRDATGTNISPPLNLKVNADGSLTSFTLTSPDERHAYSFDAWLKVGPFDLIAEYLHENVRSHGGIFFPEFDASGYYVQGSYFLIPKKLQAVVKWESLDPGQVANDNIHSITGGLNYYIHGDGIKVMADYVHTWSDFRQANPQFGDDQFDEVILRLQIMF